jgi:hypothetical protein
MALAERYLDSLLASDSVRGLGGILDEAREEAQIQGGRLASNLDWLLDRAYRLWNYAGEKVARR